MSYAAERALEAQDELSRAHEQIRDLRNALRVTREVIVQFQEQKPGLGRYRLDDATLQATLAHIDSVLPPRVDAAKSPT